MKLWNCAVAAAVLALATHLRADSGLWQIRVEMQVVSIATDAVLQLVPALRDPRQAESAVNDLQAKIARGETKLIAWPVIWTTNGVEARAETLTELRYPTEFDPPSVPQNFSNESPPPSRPLLPDATPTAYETRNLGVTLEVRPTIKDGGEWIDLDLAPAHVTFLGFKRFTFGKTRGGGIGIIDQPEFFTCKTTTAMLVRSGQWTLVGTFVVPKPEPHVELFILRATAHPLTK